MADERPLAAFGLSLAGGVLILIGGILLAIVSGIVSSAGAGGAGAILGGFALLGLVIGLLIIILAVLLYVNPEYHAAYGIGIIVLSLASIFGGGGFLIGLIIGVIGGVLALRFEEVEAPVFEWEHDSNRLGAPGTPAPVSRRVNPGVCANCHSPLPRGALRCPNCETPVRGTTASPQRDSAGGVGGSTGSR